VSRPSYVGYLAELFEAGGLRGLSARVWNRAGREAGHLRALVTRPVSGDLAHWRAGRSLRAKARVLPEVSTMGEIRRKALFDVELSHSDYRGLLERRYPRELGVLIESANGLREGRIPLLGQILQLRYPLSWHRDPLGGANWPLRNPGRIDIASKSRTADVKYVWELNRHQHLAIYALAYRATGDEQWLEPAAADIDSWIEQNPEGLGVNWKSAMEIAIRVIAWIAVLSIAQPSEVFAQAERKRRIFRSVHQQLRYLERHLSPPFDERNNHSIGEAAGLILGGLMFPEFDESDRWYESGLDLLKLELKRQVEPDGADFEHSTSYHRFVLEFAMLVLHAHRRGGRDLPWLSEIVARMTEFLVGMQRPDGRLSAFGDGDEGRGFCFAARSGYDAKHVISAAAVMLRRGDFKRAAGGLDWEAFHLLGPGTVEVFDGLTELPPILSHAFRDAGFYVMRTGADADAAHCVFDCGYLGCGAAGGGGHGHNDQLAFEYSAGGIPWITDSGTFTYLGDDRQRQYFRSTQAHSTIQIDHLEAAEFGLGHFRFLTRPAARAVHWVSTPFYDEVVGEQDAYERLDPPVTIARQLVLLKPSQVLLVRDQVAGSGRRHIGVRFQVESGIAAELKETSCRLSSDDTGTQLELMLDPRLQWTIAEGWVSHGYGSRQRRPIVFGQGDLQLPAELENLFVPVDGASAVNVDGIRDASKGMPVPVLVGFAHVLDRFDAR
jgi:hypothetical protein